MSAIDFSMQIDKEENPDGDRVVITMNGKFLPYKTWYNFYFGVRAEILL